MRATIARLFKLTFGTAWRGIVATPTGTGATVEQLCRAVGVMPLGPVAWGVPIKERRSGIYLIVTEGKVVYVGKATELAKRLRHFYRQEGKAEGEGNHKGGRDVFKLKTPLTVYWAVCDDCAGIERDLLHWHVDTFGRLPFANKVLPR
jgi:hypothetical protein